MLNRIIFSLVLCSILGCTQDNVLREKGYPRVYLPKKTYKKYTAECNYSFDIPSYCTIENKEYFRNEKLTSDSCWANIVFNGFNGKLHLSYKYYPNQETLTKLMEESYKLTSKHTIKATYIKDSIIDTDSIKGLVYTVGGNAASAKQFILTDYKHKFVRGAMYFSNTPNADSMKPVIDYVNQDIDRIIKTFKF